MSNRSRPIEMLPLVPPAGETPAAPGDYFGTKEHFLEVEVYYSKGEMNYFSGTKPARGYYVRVMPIYVQPSAGGMTGKGFTMFSGLSMLVEPAARYSDKALDKVAEVVTGWKDAKDAKYEALKGNVIARSKVTLRANVVTDNEAIAGAVVPELDAKE